MDKLFFLLVLASVSFANVGCPQYKYHDYTLASAYVAPKMPEDTLLHYCDSDKDICELTKEFNTTEDKKLFISESIANDSFSNIIQWNSNIKVGKWFSNAKNSKNIKDAWISIAYIDPSVYENGTYLVRDLNNVLIWHGFTFVVDTSKLAGDCKDIFNICGYDYSISTQNTNSDITTSLNVKSEYLVDRYHLVKHCSKSGCWTSCDFYKTENFKDSIGISDSKKIKFATFSMSSDYEVLEYYNGLAEIRINANDSNVLFKIGNSSFYKTNYLYKIRNESVPYNILIKEIIPANKTSAFGLTILGKNNSQFEVLAPYSNECSLTVSDHFYSETISECSIPNSSAVATKKIIPVQTPKFISSLFNIAALGFCAYIVYMIAKKVMHHAA